MGIHQVIYTDDQIDAILKRIYQQLQNEIYVDDYGSNASAIQAAIDASNDGDIIVFSPGVYTVESTIHFKAKRIYKGAGRKNTILKQTVNNLDEDYMVIVDNVADDDAATYIKSAETCYNPVKNILVQGLTLLGFRQTTSDENTSIAALETDEFSPFLEIENGTNTGYSGGSPIDYNNGMLLKYVQDSLFIDFGIRFCGRDGLVLSGKNAVAFNTPYNQTTATNFFINCWIYGNNRYGVYFDTPSQDNHFISCDIGYNQYENIWFASGSNSINETPVWGCRESNGILIGASSNQIRNCQVEGNAQHGIKIVDYGFNNLITGCKIYYNSTQTDASYDGVYIGGTGATNQPKNNSIIGNFIYSGLNFGVSVNKHRRSITLDTYHENIHISGNAFQYSGQDGDLDLDTCVYGLTTGDTLDGITYIISSDRPSTAITSNINGRFFYETDTANWKRYSTWNSRWETLLTSPDKPQGANDYAIAQFDTSEDITFSTEMSNTNYAIIIELQWNDTWYISAKSTTGFTVNFGTGSVAGASALNWAVIPHSY